MLNKHLITNLNFGIFLKRMPKEKGKIVYEHSFCSLKEHSN